MTPNPTTLVETAVTHLTLGRAQKSAAGEFESLLAKFDGSRQTGDGGLPDTSEKPAGSPSRDDRGTRSQAMSPQAPDPQTHPPVKLLKAREVAARALEPGERRHLDRVAARLEAATRRTANAETDDTGGRLPRVDAGKMRADAEKMGLEDEPSHDKRAEPAAIARAAAPAHLAAPVPAATADNEVEGEAMPDADEPRPPVADTAATSQGAPVVATNPDMARPRKALPAPQTQQRPASAPPAAAEGEPEAPTADGEDVAAPRDRPLAARNEPQVLRRPVPLSPQDDAVQAKPLGAIAVTRRETHLAPVRRPAAIEEHHLRRQLPPEPQVVSRNEPAAARAAFTAVAEQLSKALDSTRDQVEAKLQQASQQAAPLARPLTPVRVVELSLQPASLGALSITIRLTGSGLRVTVSATSRETADLLREDREALATLIDGAGYEANEIIVTHRPRAGALSAGSA